MNTKICISHYCFLIVFYFVEDDVMVSGVSNHRAIIALKNKESQAIQSPRTVPFFLLVSLLDGYSFPNVLVKGIVTFKH